MTQLFPLRGCLCFTGSVHIEVASRTPQSAGCALWFLPIAHQNHHAAQLTNMTSSNIAQSAAKLLSLEEKVAMVTGAASGIERGIAIRLAEMGAFIAILDVEEAGSAQ